jgi:hypothetical protein
MREHGNVLAAFTEGGDGNREDVETIVKVLPEAPGADLGPRSRLVVAMMRTSALTGPEPPMRSNSRSCSTRRSFG